jgi:eukaryotic-like serine/threonine-protein kinase
MTSVYQAPQAGRQLGRFELRRPLGQGAQASVWLAWDPTLQREVAIKCLLPGAVSGAGELSHWLAEGRAMSALSHPGIVTVHEAHEQGGQAWLVMAHVDGGTLAERLRQQGRMPVEVAVRLMIEVLQALSCAHAAGIVHRDLKPSNILVDQAGHAHVMDFGIAARLSDQHDGTLAGSPGYISPEAAAGRAPCPSMDIFAAGLLLGELLCGQALRPPVPMAQALHRARHEQVRWPAGSAEELDDKLHAVVLRAVALAPEARFDSAASFCDALQAWLLQSDEGSRGNVDTGHGTLAFLLRRMRQTGDFPALSDSVLRIQRITSSDSGSLHTLSAEVLKDVALTHKLLRLVNAAKFRHTSAGEICTVSRAAALIGFAGIRNLAMSVMLLEHMKDRSRARRMKELFLQALLTAMLTDHLTPASAEREEAFLAGMLSHLGRLLVNYLFPDEALRIRDRTRPQDPLSESAAAVEVLGLSLDQLGQGVAQSWDLPGSLRKAMSPPEGDWPVRRLDVPAERLRWQVRAAGELVQTLMDTEPAQADAALKRRAEQQAHALGCPVETILEAVQATRAQLAEMAASLQIDPAPQSKARRLLGEDPASENTLALPASGARSSDLLSAGVADLSEALTADQPKLNDILRMAVETLFRALSATRVLLALRDPRTGCITGRLGLGQEVEGLQRRCSVDVRGQAAADLFAAACLKGVDTLITDGQASKLQARLPVWYRVEPAPSFLLLPMLIKSAPMGFFLIERQQPIVLEDRELSLLRSLRNQAVLAFKTAT